MRRLELRRHAPRDPQADKLSSDGQILAEQVGATLEGPYDALFVSPKQRAAETAAWFLRGLKQAIPQTHGVAEGLAPPDHAFGPEDAKPVVDAIRQILSAIPEGGRGLVVGHTPMLETAAEALTGTAVLPFRECEGVLLVAEQGQVTIDREYRLGSPT